MISHSPRFLQWYIFVFPAPREAARDTRASDRRYSTGRRDHDVLHPQARECVTASPAGIVVVIVIWSARFMLLSSLVSASQKLDINWTGLTNLLDIPGLKWVYTLELVLVVVLWGCGHSDEYYLICPVFVLKCFIMRSVCLCNRGQSPHRFVPASMGAIVSVRVHFLKLMNVFHSCYESFMPVELMMFFLCQINSKRWSLVWLHR